MKPPLPAVRPVGIRSIYWRAGWALWGLALLFGGFTLVLQLRPTAWSDLTGAVAGQVSRLNGQAAGGDFHTATGLGPAPDFTVALFDGGSFRLAEQRGNVVVLNFWASWCVPCRTESPRLQAASQTYRDRGVVFIGVDIQDDDKDARAFLKQYGLTYATGPDHNLAISQSYGVSGLPTTFFVDRQGQIVRRWLGEVQDAQLTGFIDETLR